MTERPILFSAEMVRAILDGRKTMTRRVVKPQPKDHHWKYNNSYHLEHKLLASKDILWAKFWHTITENPERDGIQWSKFPYGQVGDLLWVRETFWLDDGDDQPFYKATEPSPQIFTKWKPSIFMPRWASRITLEITNVKAERLQDITEDAANKEGVYIDGTSSNGHIFTAREHFEGLWDFINGKKYPWLANPWVWVIEFQKVERNPL